MSSACRVQYHALIALTDGPEGADPSIGPNGLAEIGAGQRCSVQLGPIQVRVDEIGIGEVGVSEVGIFEIGPLEVDSGEVGAIEVHPRASRIRLQGAVVDDLLRERRRRCDEKANKE